MISPDNDLFCTFAWTKHYVYVHVRLAFLSDLNKFFKTRSHINIALRSNCCFFFNPIITLQNMCDIICLGCILQFVALRDTVNMNFVFLESNDNLTQMHIRITINFTSSFF